MHLYLLNWWLLPLRGVLAVVMGTVIMIWEPMVHLFLILFGIYLLLDGILTLAGAVVGTENGKPLWMVTAKGVFEILLSATTFIWLSASFLTLTILIALWAFTSGVLDMLACPHLRRALRGKCLLHYIGMLSLLLSFTLLFLYRSLDLTWLTWIFGITTIASGALMLLLGLHIRTVRQEMQYVQRTE